MTNFVVNGASVRDLGQETGHALFVVEPVDAWASDLVRLTIELRWTEADDESALPVLSFPEHLPKPASALGLVGDYLRAPLYVETNVLSTVDVVGVQQSEGPWNPHDEAQLQISFIPRQLVVFRSDDLIVARQDAVNLAASRYAEIGAELARVRAFLENELDFQPSARVAVLIPLAPVKLDRIPGAVIPIPPTKLAPDGGFEREIHLNGAEKLAAVWWGAGVQMPGRYGDVVEVGLRYALWLRQLGESGNVADLDAATKRLRTHADTPVPATASAQRFDMTLLAQLVLLLSAALAEQPSVRRALADATRDLWGTKPRAEDVLSRLRSAGLELPERAPHLSDLDERAEAVLERQYDDYVTWGKPARGQVAPRLVVSPQFERQFWGFIYAIVGLGVMISVWAIIGALPPNATRAIGPIAFVGIGLTWWRFWRSFSHRIVRDLGWATRTVVQRARRRLNPLASRLFRWRIEPTVVAGLRAYVVGDTSEQRAERAYRVGRAMEEIRTMWPSRYSRLLRLAPSIDVMPFHAAGGYMFGVNSIVLSAPLVDTAPPDALAAVLIHELSHAYCDSRGIGVGPWAETRGERIAHSEMMLWSHRLHRGGRTEAASATLSIYRNSMRRWWWRADGTRYHGSEFDAA